MLLLLSVAPAQAEDPVATPTRFHLTPRPWTPLNTTPKEMLDVVEGLCRFTATVQNAEGAVIDPYLHREFQYSTPYFAFAVGVLVRSGRARDLLPRGVLAMESATRQIALGRTGVPDEHGEFFLASLTEALPLYQSLVPSTQWKTWRSRLRLPIGQIVRGLDNNWQTYAMKGEWQRSRLRLVSHDDAVRYVEVLWRDQQRGRFASQPYHLYHDRSSDPDTLSVALVGEGNLLAMLRAGYDGPSAKEMRSDIETALRTTLLLADPTGQAPANGRTDDHIWPDIGMQLGFEAMAWQLQQRGDLRQAGAFRRAANLAFRNIARWRRDDGAFAGSYYITKNHFDPALRVGYQTATQYSNYTGSLMFHLAEVYLLRKQETVPIRELPAPSELGGYAIELDPQFATVFADAGGMQLHANLRGETQAANGNWWTPLGIVRLSRAGWDSRLGPSDGAQTDAGGLTIAPEFLRDGRWVRLADLPSEYEAHWTVQQINPALVRCAVDYAPRADRAGPAFHQSLTLTPDGVFSEVRLNAPQDLRWGMTWPLLENDGRPLITRITRNIAETRMSDGTDSESFLAVDPDATLTAEDTTLRSTYGDLRPIRIVEPGINRTFVYPHNADEPTADAVVKSFQRTADGFHSILGRVAGKVYIGRTFAGGTGRRVDISGDGKQVIDFDHECEFVMSLKNGKVTEIETDRTVVAHLSGRQLVLSSFHPRMLKERNHID